MPRDLSSLSPELLVIILQSLSSPRDLYAIIRTSSQFYRIFATYKHSTLSANLLNAISPNVEADFTIAHRAQRIWKLLSKHITTTRDRRARDEKFSSLKQESIAILEEFRNSGQGERLSKMLSDRTLLQDMLKFYCNFEHLMVSYSNRALRQSFSGSNELSFTERTRLQRAFFRWEIYTCLFQISQVRGARYSAPPTDPAPKFAAMLRFWEVEEICCVGQFYKVLIEELCDRIEEDFVTMVKKKMEARVSVSEETLSVQQKESGLNYLEFECLRWYVESFKPIARSEHNDYVVSRGMLCVRKLTTEPFLVARKMIVKSDIEAHGETPILLEFRDSNYRGRKEVGQGFGERLPDEIDSDDMCLRRCNFGWIWAAGDEMGLNAPANYELRNRGYVFWDKARLLMFETFQSPRDPVNFWEFPPGYQKHSELPGVQAKLKDVPVHVDVVVEIADEINGRKAGEDYDDDDYVDVDCYSRTNWRN